MEKTLYIRGKIVSGAHRAASFTRLDWVTEQCLGIFGFVPFPGTVNLEVVKEDFPLLEQIRKEEPILLIPPDEIFCEGRTLRASIENLEGCIFIPPKDVNIHKESIIEFMAPVMVKETLGVEDGDVVILSVNIEH